MTKTGSLDLHSLQTGYGDINKETPKDSGLLKMEGVWIFVFCLFFALSLTRVEGLVQWLDGVRTPNAPVCPGLVGFHAKTWKVLGKPRRAGAPGCWVPGSVGHVGLPTCSFHPDVCDSCSGFHHYSPEQPAKKEAQFSHFKYTTQKLHIQLLLTTLLSEYGYMATPSGSLGNVISWVTMCPDKTPLISDWEENKYKSDIWQAAIILNR